MRIPGKLMLAGEYAVLRPGGLALALAVERHLTVRATPASLPGLSTPWWTDGPRPTGGGAATGDPFADAALAAARGALAALGLAERPLHLAVGSTLGAAGQPKPGLGGSAALTAGLVAALLAAHGLDPCSGATRPLLLGLALAAHLAAQGWQGSGYDVATVLEGGVVAFRPLASLAAQARERAAAGLAVDEQARALARQVQLGSLTLPDGLLVRCVHSGQAAATPALIAAAQQADPALLDDAALAVLGALEAGEAPGLLAAVNRAQRCFELWDAAHRLGLMTPTLRTLAGEARAAGLVPRVSGAGGGDSLLVLGTDAEAVRALDARWLAAGQPFWPVTVDGQGAALLAG